jgi:hypothetical protein
MLPEEELFKDEEEALAVAGALGEDLLSIPCSVPNANPLQGADKDPPETVASVPRLQSDMNALEKIFMGDTPIQVIKHPVLGAWSLAFGGGDASGEGFGSLIFLPWVCLHCCAEDFGMLLAPQIGVRCKIFWGQFVRKHV